MKLIKKLLGMSKKSGRTTEQQVSRKELAKALAAKAKKYGRTIEQQEYRDGLAKKLKDARKYSSDLAKTLLETEMGSIPYIRSEGDEYLINGGTIDALIKNIDEIKCKGCFGKNIAMELIRNERCDKILNNLELFKGLDKTIAEYLLKYGRVFRRYTYFGDEGLDIEINPPERIKKNLDSFESLKGIDWKEITNYVLDDTFNFYFKKYYEYYPKPRIFFKNILNICDNPTAVANVLFDRGLKDCLFNWIDYCCNKGFDLELAEKLIEKGRWEVVIRNIDKFKGSDHKVIAEKLIEKGHGRAVIKNIDKIQGLCHEMIAEKLIASEGWVIVEYLEKFKLLNHKVIAEKLIEKGYGRTVVVNIDKFSIGRFNKKIAKGLIRNNGASELVKYLYRFDGLDEEIANELIKRGYGDVVFRNPEKFGLKKDK